MKYRVIVKVGYNELQYDFDDWTDVGAFTKTVLTHQCDSGKVVIQLVKDGEETEDEE